MKKEIGLLTIGFFMGIVLMRQEQSPLPSVQDIKSQQDNISAPALIAKKIEPFAKEAPSIKVAEPIKQIETVAKIENKHVNFPTEAAQVKTSKFITNTITEYTIGQLEATEELLQNAVYSESTETGWRIHVLKNDNLLTQNGVIDGDIITFKSLETQRQSDPKRAQLADRMERLLNHIKR